jgi:TolB-like protein/Tfp pilus assembly protein PilF
VGEAALTQAISQLRRALGDDADGGILRTIRGRGYRVEVPVEPLEGASSSPAPLAQANDAEQPSPTQPERVPAGSRKVRRRLAAGAVAAVLVATGLLLAVPPDIPRPEATVLRVPLAADDAVAVLPFADMSPGGDQEYLADGISEEITNSLAQVDDLRVVARTSAFAFKGTNDDVRSIGRKLGVGTVVEGSVRRHRERLRVTAQVIDVSNGFHRWSQTYERPAEDVFAVQQEIADAVALAVRRGLGEPGGARLASPRPADLRAWEAVLRGRAERARRSPESTAAAVAHFEEAIAIDPDYAPAHADLSGVLIGLAYFRANDPQLKARAEAEARRALALDPDSAEAHAALARILTIHHEPQRAEVHIRRALQQNPGSAEIRAQYAGFLARRGRLAAARVQAEKALSLDPLSPVMNRQLGRFYYYAGEVDAALPLLWRSLELNPSDVYTPSLLWMTYEAKGMEAEAREMLLRLAPGWSRPPLRLLGRLLGTRTVLRLGLGFETLRTGEPCPHIPESIAMLRAYLGDGERTLECIRWAIEHDDEIGYVRVHPLYDPYRSDPRFVALVESAP